MDLKTNLISICSTNNIFLKSPFKIKKIFFMYKNNYQKSESKMTPNKEVKELILFLTF